MKIEGRTIIITGAGSGIGEATARMLARENPGMLVLVDMSQRVHEVAGSITSTSGRLAPNTWSLVGNTTDAAFRVDVFDKITSLATRSCYAYENVPSILIPCAGITRDGPCVTKNPKNEYVPSSAETDDLVHNVNFVAPTEWAKEMFVRIMAGHPAGWGADGKEEPTGVVVFVGSVSARGNKFQTNYAASKAALVAWAESAAKEVAKFGILPKIIHPGFTDTPMVRVLKPEIIDKVAVANTRLGRLIQPDEIAHSIKFLIENDAVNSIVADGGFAFPAK